MSQVCADTGPLLHLHEAGAVHLLPLLGTVVVSPLVVTELRVHARTLWPTVFPDWLKLQSLSTAAHQRARAWQQAGLLHGGEAQTLALALELKPRWFLTDDAAARLMAESLGVETHGSLGVVLWTAAHRLVGEAEAKAMLAALENSSLWMSSQVREQARVTLAIIFATNPPA